MPRMSRIEAVTVIDPEAMRAFGAEVRLEGRDFDAAKAEVHALLYELASVGIAIPAISSELPEILTIGDRIVTMREGRVTGEHMRADASEERLMQLMALGRSETAWRSGRAVMGRRSGGPLLRSCRRDDSPRRLDRQDVR